MVQIVTDRERLRRRNLRYFGVIADSTAEAERNQQKIEQAILSKAADGGGELIFPQASTIHISGNVPMRSRVDVKGHGRGSKLTLHDDGCIRARADDAGEGLEWWSLTDMHITKSVPTSEAAQPIIDCASDSSAGNCRRFELGRLHIESDAAGENIVGGGIIFRGAFAAWVHDMRISGIAAGSGSASLRDFCLKSEAIVGGSSGCTTLHFERVDMQGSALAGWFDVVRQLTFDRCYTQGISSQGLVIGRGNDAVHIARHWFEDCAAWPLRIGNQTTSGIRNKNVTVQRSHFTDGDAANPEAIEVTDYCDDVFITENFFEDYGTEAINYTGTTNSSGGYRDNLLDNTPSICTAPSATFGDISVAV